MNAPNELKSSTYTADEALEVARHHFRAKDFPRARRVCEAILGVVPDHLETLELFGDLCVRLGQGVDALSAIDRALVQRPDLAALHLLHGKLLQRLSRAAEAIASLERACALGAAGEALRCMADLHVAIGDGQSAVDVYQRAIALEPTAADLLSNCGSVLKTMGRLDEALQSHRRAVAASPNAPDLLNNLANTLQAMGRHAEALEIFDQILGLDPAALFARRGRAVSLMRIGRVEPAAEAFGWLVHRGARDPSILQAWSLCLSDAGRYREALQAIDHALVSLPDNPELLAQRGMLLMTLGRFAEGLPLFEHRFGSGHFSVSELTRLPASKRWAGEHSPAGLTLLLHAEQGLGDTLQFCRYARALAAMGATVALEVDRSMVGLIGSLSPKVSVLARGDALPDFDLHCPLMSLPWAWMTLSGNFDCMAQPDGYLHADPEDVLAWRSRLAGTAGQSTIGIAWRGRSTHRNTSQRDIPLSELLAALPMGPRYVSLQRDLNTDERALLASRGDVLNIGDELTDFADSAAVVTLIDRVVTVDTSVAHLAGALGRPVTVLLPFAPDWRWQVAGSTSSWYPTMTLCRQAARGSWTGALAGLERSMQGDLPDAS